MSYYLSIPSSFYSTFLSYFYTIYQFSSKAHYANILRLMNGGNTPEGLHHLYGMDDMALMAGIRGIEGMEGMRGLESLEGDRKTNTW